ncbi:Acyl-CoA synthetase (NDP forming) [Sphingobium faniae]|nr:Acyl-CoA synthetase (NDP forming) [Sphingobium faniae]
MTERPSQAAQSPLPLSSIFNPASVGVVGVSQDATKLGNKVLANIRSSGFAGEVVAVGSATQAEGIDVVASLDALDRSPELLFAAVPATATVDLVRQAGARGTRALIVGASGFAEDGEEGAALQRTLGDAAAQAGVRIVGPNCNGVYSGHASLSIGFNTGHGRRHELGDVAILSHSGALFDALVRRLEDFGAGLSIFTSAGNELDLDVLDYLDHALLDPDTQVIALLLDSVPDGRRLRTQAARARQLGKPIVALKIGESEQGAAAAAAHSSRLAGDAASYRALFAASGIATASSLEGLMAAAAMLSRFGHREGGLSALCTSGAGASIIADLAARHGARLAEYGAETVERLSARRRFSHFGNPTDIGVFGSMKGIGEVVTTLASDSDTAAFLCMMHSMGEGRPEIMSAAWKESTAANGKPHIVLAPGGLPDDDAATQKAGGAVLFTESAACFDALAALMAPAPEAVELDLAGMPVIDPGVAAGPMNEKTSLALLAAAGVTTVETRLCDSLDDAIAAANDLVWPVAMKGMSEGVAHKTEHGFVQLDLKDEAALRAAWDRMGAPAVVVQPMIRGDLEAIVGVTANPATGPILLVGLGGIHAEAIGQAALWSLPVSPETLARGLDESAIGRVLASARWPHADTRGKLLHLLGQVQAFALVNQDRLAAVDLNPVMLGARGAIAVDGLVIVAEGEAA